MMVARSIGVLTVVAALFVLGANRARAEGASDPKDRKIVAVLPLEDQTGLPPDRVEALSDYLRIRIGALGVVDVVDKGLQAAETKRMINEAQAESYLECVDEACQIPLGKQLAANYILRGKLTKFEATSVVSLELIDVATAASTAAVSERISSGADALLVAIDGLAEQLASRLKDADEPEAVGGLGVLGIVSGNAFTVLAEPTPPPEEGPSVARGVVYLSVAASLLAGGILLDVLPASARNGGLDFLDIVPIVMYGASALFAFSGSGNFL